MHFYLLFAERGMPQRPEFNLGVDILLTATNMWSEFCQNVQNYNWAIAITTKDAKKQSNKQTINYTEHIKLLKRILYSMKLFFTSVQKRTNSNCYMSINEDYYTFSTNGKLTVQLINQFRYWLQSQKPITANIWKSLIAFYNKAVKKKKKKGETYKHVKSNNDKWDILHRLGESRAHTMDLSLFSLR